MAETTGAASQVRSKVLVTDCFWMGAELQAEARGPAQLLIRDPLKDRGTLDAALEHGGWKVIAFLGNAVGLEALTRRAAGSSVEYQVLGERPLAWLRLARVRAMRDGH